MDQEDDPKEGFNKLSGVSEQLEFAKDSNALNTEGNEETHKTTSKASASKKKQEGIDRISDNMSDFHVESEENITNMGTRRTLFGLFWISTLFLNLDTGVIPTA